jgi:hypothetical protein
MPPNPKQVLRQKAARKAWGKNLYLYIGSFIGLACILVFFYYAEQQAQVERNWAATYPRRCEVCQTMVLGSIYTKALIQDNNKKQMDEERAAIPELAGQPPPEQEPVKAQFVLRHVCEEGQINHLISTQQLHFKDGFKGGEDQEFVEGLKKTMPHDATG